MPNKTIFHQITSWFPIRHFSIHTFFQKRNTTILEFIIENVVVAEISIVSLQFGQIFDDVPVVCVVAERLVEGGVFE